MRKALITGGAGFIGLCMAKRLTGEGFEVDLFDNFSRAVEDPDLAAVLATGKVKMVKGNALDPKDLAALADDYELIFHFAAIIGVSHVLKQPYLVLRDNVAMLANAIELGRRQKQLKRFVFASTSEVYAGTLQHFEMAIPTPEGTPLALTDLSHPRTSYMLSKIYGEAMCFHSGLPVTVIRPHNVYGPRMGLSHVVPELLKKSYEAPADGTIPVFSPDHRRAFCFVDDAVNLTLACALSPKGAGQVFNIGNQDCEIPMKELVEVIIKTTAKQQKVSLEADTPGSPARRCPDMTRTIEVAGFMPQVDLAEGVARTFSWYRQNIFDGGQVCAK